MYTSICLDNIFMGLLVSTLAKSGAMKPIFLDSGHPRGERGEGVRASVGMVCYHDHCIAHILNSSKKNQFSLSLTAICTELCFQTT